jgi:hypothetical protein
MRGSALLVIAALLLSPAHARAESLGQRVEGPWPTEKKFVVYSLFGVSALSLAYGVFSYAKMQSELSDHYGLFPRNGDVVDCATADACARLRESRREVDAWTDHSSVAFGVAGAVGLAAVATAFLWPNGAVRVEPAAGRGAGLSLRGTF